MMLGNFGKQLITKMPSQKPMHNPKPLHCNLSEDQFRLVRWAHLQKRGIDLGEFFRVALFDAVGKAVSHAASRNRLPPGVAKDFDLWRQKML